MNSRGNPARMMELVDIRDLKSLALKACRFDSYCGHHKGLEQMKFHWWFAWYPCPVGWLRFVERRRVMIDVDVYLSTERSITFWEYRNE